ncbi:hypothetical protein J1N35_007750 [Gossypium stocksii]|uniref:DUF4283 domain-containing protein n=1 Tax=Gossypium stocksii TaxID=47602 RepID=A0A9D4ADR6_9ROSI|nr:hypothetical protein J1N35_007750 [Gossypium stocksii]
MELQNSDYGTNKNPCDDGDRSTKKVRFKEAVDGEETNMVVDSNKQLRMSFKDKLLGGGVDSSDGNLVRSLEKNECDFEILDVDVKTSMVNRISAFTFLDRIKDLLFKEIELMVILKLLGRNIDYNDTDDYNKVLAQGPWIIFGQYLTVQSWTKSFNLVQPYPSVVMAWIRLLGLSGYL